MGRAVVGLAVGPCVPQDSVPGEVLFSQRVSELMLPGCRVRFPVMVQLGAGEPISQAGW